MRCPFCGHLEDKVVDSRESREGDSIRRRRECLKCGRRFTSYERLEEVPILIVKKDGRREPFDRQKLLRGVMAACQKRPVSLSRLEEAVGDIQARLMEHPDREIPSRTLGELVMDALKGIDSVAYVRFASVYRDFKDLPDFVKALEGLMVPVQAAPGQAAPGQATPVQAAPVPAAQVPRPSAPASKAPAAAEKPQGASPVMPTPLFPGVDPDSPRAARRRKP